MTTDTLAAMTPDELIAVITRGLNEDEEAAKRVRQPYRLYACDDGHIEEPMRVNDLHAPNDGEYQQWGDGEDRLPNHHNSWALVYDPSRVLADVQAKREILAEYKEASEFYGDRPDAPAGEMSGLYFVLKRLARPYLDQETP